MATIEIAETVDQLLEGMRRLSDREQRMLAAAVLIDRSLEPFVEEIDDHLACESALAEDAAEPLNLPSHS